MSMSNTDDYNNQTNWNEKENQRRVKYIFGKISRK